MICPDLQRDPDPRVARRDLIIGLGRRQARCETGDRIRLEHPAHRCGPRDRATDLHAGPTGTRAVCAPCHAHLHEHEADHA